MGDGIVLEPDWLTGDRLTFSDVDLLIWELEDPRLVETSGGDVEDPELEDTGDRLGSEDEPEEGAGDSRESLSAGSIIWPGM